MNLRYIKLSKRGKMYRNIFCLCTIFLFILIMIMNQKDDIYDIKATEYEHTVSSDIKDNSDINDPGIYDQDDINQNDNQDKKVILIDPGHGGYDPGCNYDDILESIINLDISILVRDELLLLGYDVIMTREEDTSLPLAKRVELIKTYTPDLFISIHQNSLEGDSVTNGVETWYYDKINDNSIMFAEYIQAEVINLTGAKDRGAKLHNSLAVIKNVNCPACLIETGFLSSTEERGILNSQEYKEKLAKSIVNGIDRFIKEKLTD